MATMVEVKLNEEVLCVGELSTAPYLFWHGVIVDTNTELDTLVERLQVGTAQWEGFPLADGGYKLLLPPNFKVNKIETVF